MLSRKTVVACVSVAALAIAAAAFWVLPYWSVAGLMKAAAAEDVGRAAGFIEERRVERTIRAQTSDAVQAQALKGVVKDWPGAEAALQSDRSAPLADALSNVAAVTDLVRSHLPVESSRLAVAWHLVRSGEGDLLPDGVYRINATGDYTFTWQRHRASWKLVDVSIPSHVIESAAISGESPVIQPEVESFKHP